MRLNLTVIADWLNDFPITKSHPGNPYAFPYETCRIWAPDEEPSSSILYICASHLLPPAPVRGRIGFICIGTLPKDYPASRADYLCVPAGTDLLRLVNEVVDIFSRFDVWDRRLQEAVMSPQPLTSLAVIAHEVFVNDLCCWDTNGYLLAHARTPGTPLHAGYPSTDAELANNDWFYIRADAVKDRGPSPIPVTVHVGVYWANSIVCDVFDETGQPAFSGSDADGGQWLSQTNLEQLSEDALLARLTLDDTIHEFKASDPSLLFHVSSYFGAALLQDDSLRVSSSAAFDQMLKAMLAQERPYKVSYEAVLASDGWHKLDPYRCVVAVSARGELTQNRAARLATLIQRRLPHSYPYQLQDSLVVLINMRRTRELFEPVTADNDIWALLEPLLAAHSCCAAISDEFADFAQSLQYEQQAVKTLDAGRQHNPDTVLYRFETSALDLLLQNSRGELPPERYCTARVQALLEYDHDHEGGLVRTLAAWLRSGAKINQITKELKINKTTLYYRLRRVEEITGLNLGEYRTRLYLCILLETVPQLQEAAKG